MTKEAFTKQGPANQFVQGLIGKLNFWSTFGLFLVSSLTTFVITAQFLDPAREFLTLVDQHFGVEMATSVLFWLVLLPFIALGTVALFSGVVALACGKRLQNILLEA